ncbi:MAG TPA: S8 family serine peptidase, partial [Acidimicrobiales bacterium]|nr:S8 family serine peptidase [Acidimicrobiales bacterium]
MPSLLRFALALTLLLGLLPGAFAAPATAAQPPRPEQAPVPEQRRAEHVPDRYIVAYRSSVADPRGKTDRLERARGFRADQRYGQALKGFAATLSGPQVAALAEDPDVEFISPDRPVRASAAVPVPSGETVPSGVRRIEAATAETTRQAGTAQVAIVDTGIDLDHPDLNVANGINCIGSGPAEDDNGHGTHVAGTVAASNNGAGVIGVAPDTRLHAVKVLDSTGAGTWSSMICGIDWVSATRTDADPGNDIAVANLSLGGSGPAVGTCATTTDALHRAICNSTNAGVTFVVAAGNESWDFDYPQTPSHPAAYPEVLTVAAATDSDGLPGGGGGAGCGDDDTYAGFSNFASTSGGAAHLVAAPGSCILSTAVGGTYATMSGTSMAAPHVAGLAALCLGEGGAPGPCTGLSPAHIIAKIRSDAQAHTTADSLYGFAGDPLRLVTGRSYGYLAWAANDPLPDEGGGYHALEPSRILDTRSGNGAPAAKVGPGARVDLQVTGRGGVPATGVTAVVM